MSIAHEGIEVLTNRSGEVTELGTRAGENLPDFTPITAMSRYRRCHHASPWIAHTYGMTRYTTRNTVLFRTAMRIHVYRVRYN
jgi:hypothetical protein